VPVTLSIRHQQCSSPVLSSLACSAWPALPLDHGDNVSSATASVDMTVLTHIQAVARTSTATRPALRATPAKSKTRTTRSASHLLQAVAAAKTRQLPPDLSQLLPAPSRLPPGQLPPRRLPPATAAAPGEFFARDLKAPFTRKPFANSSLLRQTHLQVLLHLLRRRRHFRLPQLQHQHRRLRLLHQPWFLRRCIREHLRCRPWRSKFLPLLSFIPLTPRPSTLLSFSND
jgi:hypothetical protein